MVDRQAEARVLGFITGKTTGMFSEEFVLCFCPGWVFSLLDPGGYSDVLFNGYIGTQEGYTQG